MTGWSPRQSRFTRALVVALGGAVACGEPPPASPPAPSSQSAPPAVAVVPVADTSAADCRDWSTLDLAELPPLTRGRQAPLLDQVWRRVLAKHYDPTLGCLPWGELRETYALRVAEAATDAEAYDHIQAMLDELGQSHLQLFPPGRGEQSMGPAAPALTVRWIEEQLVVVESRAEAQPRELAGATLLGIDGRPLAPLVEEVRARSEPHAFPHAIARAVAVRLSCARAGAQHELELATLADPRPTTIAVPCLLPAGERVTLGNLREIPTRVEHRMLDHGVGLLAFNVWMLPMVERVRAAMQELREQGMRALVLDLRGNPGGVGAMAVPVARLLLTRDASLGTMRFRDFAQELRVEPSEAGFDGPVAVLVDEGTASTSEIFVVGLRDLGRITVVGARPSAGTALPSVLEELHGGALLQSVVADYRSPRGTVVEGAGIVPDVSVVETREAFGAGRDPVLEAAHDHLLELVRNVPMPNGQPGAGADAVEDADRAVVARP